MAYCALTISGGTRGEDDLPEGTAHFVEHALFKGTRRKSARVISSYLDRWGGELNAYTTKEEIVLHATVLKEDLRRASDLLMELAFEAMFPEKEIEMERGVIIDEIQSYMDVPSDDIYDRFEAMLFEGHPLSRLILGTVKSVKKIRREHLMAFCARWFRYENMVLTLVGPQSEAQLKALVCRLSKRWAGKAPGFSRAGKKFSGPEKRAPEILFTCAPSTPSHCASSPSSEETEASLTSYLPTVYELRSFPPSRSEEETNSLFSRSCVVSCVPASQELVSGGPLPLPVAEGGHAPATTNTASLTCPCASSTPSHGASSQTGLETPDQVGGDGQGVAQTFGDGQGVAQTIGDGQGSSPSCPAATGHPFSCRLKKHNHQCNCVLGFTGPSLREKERRIGTILLCNILGGPATNSRLNSILREKNGWVYSVECAYTPYADTGIVSVTFGCEHEHLEDCLRVVKREIRRLREEALSPRAFSVSCRQLLAQMAVSAESGEAQALSMGKSVASFGTVHTSEEDRQAIFSLSPEYLRTLAEELFEDARQSLLIYE